MGHYHPSSYTFLNIYGYDDTAYAGQCKDYILENNLSKWIHIKGYRERVCGYFGRLHLLESFRMAAAVSI